MQRNLLSLLLLTVVLTGIVSCSRTDKSGLAIPKDAALAVHVNVPSLTSKLTWQEIQQNEWFKKLYSEEADSLGKKIMDNPASSGIDLKSDLAFFIKKQGQGGYFAFEGSVNDAAAFEAFAQKINQGGKVAKNGDVNVMEMSRKSLVAWTGKRFIFIADMYMPSVNLNSSGNYTEPFSFHTDSLQKFAVQLFDLSKKDNLTNDERFSALLKETGDIHYWVNAEQYYNNLGGLLSLVRLNALFEGTAYGTAINFDNGKITLKSKSFLSKELRNMVDKYSPGSVSADMINRIPSQNVIAVFAAKYPPAAFKDLAKLLNVDGFVNSFFGSVGFSTDEFVKATKGDVLLSVTDFDMKPQEITINDPDGKPYTVKQDGIPNAKILFATSVNDKPSFDKLFGILQSKIQENAGEIANKVHFQLNNDWFAAGNAPEQVNGFVSGGNSHLPFVSRIAGHAFGGYINIQQLLKSVQPSVSDSNSKAAMDLSINTWQDVVMTSGGEKDGAFTGEIEVNMVDKNTNSLKQLNKYIDTITKLFLSKHGQYNAQVNYNDPAALGQAALAPVMH